MHQTRQAASMKLPIERKGTKYIARATSHLHDSVPVVIAVRDMLKLAKTAREVKKVILEKILKINNRPVRDYRESIKLFNIFEADKSYMLSILSTGKFFFDVPIKKELRICKVANKRLIEGGKIQLNLHDGTNIISKDKVTIGDSLYLDFSGKIKSHVVFEKGAEVFVLIGKYRGQKGNIQSIDENKVKIKFKEGEAVMDKNNAIVI